MTARIGGYGVSFWAIYHSRRIVAVVTSWYGVEKSHTPTCQLCRFSFKSTIWKWTNQHLPRELVCIHNMLSLTIDYSATNLNPLRCSLAFNCTATNFWFSFYFVMYNIHAGWAEDWMGETGTFGNNEAKKPQCPWLGCYQ